MREHEFRNFVTKLKYLLLESDNRMSRDVLEHLKTLDCDKAIDELVDVKKLNRLWGEN